MDKHLYSIEDACNELSIGKTTLYNLMEEKKLLFVRVGTKRLIPMKCLEDFCNELMEQGGLENGQ